MPADGRHAQHALGGLGDRDARQAPAARARPSRGRTSGACSAACRTAPTAADPPACRSSWSSSTWRCGSASASPTTANGQRSRVADRRNVPRSVRGDRQHVALLRLVAPDLERRQRRVGARDPTKVDPRAAPAILHQFGQRVRQPAGADVVDEANRIAVAELPAAIDHFLAPVLHLGVVALDRREIEVGVARAGRHRRGRAAAEADEHRRTAEHDEQRARRDVALRRRAPRGCCPARRRS